MFESIDEKLESEPNSPLFAVGTNGSHHYPLHDNPNHTPSPSGSTKRAHDFLASLHNEDAWLATFYEELAKRPALRDALVGDHSFPADEHGIHFNGPAHAKSRLAPRLRCGGASTCRRIM